jgi:hypothetical protein
MERVYIVHAQLGATQTESDPVIRVFMSSNSAYLFAGHLNNQNRNKNLFYYVRHWELYF